MVRCARALRPGEQGQGEHRQARQDRGDERLDLRSARSDGASFRNQKGKEKRDDAEIFSRLPDREHAFARREQSACRPDLVFHPGNAGRDRFCRDEGQTDSDARLGSGIDARADERARGESETEGQLRSWRNGQGRGRPVPKSERRRGRDRSGAGQAARFGDNFRPRDAGRTRILASRTRIVRAGQAFYFMAKEVVAQIKLQIPAGQANPAPPVGTALGPRGINIMAFCKEFNAATQKQAGDILPVVITVFKDKSFTFITKSPPAAVLLKKAANIAAGSKEPNKEKVGKVTRKQVMDIVKTKRKDLNARSDEAAFRIIEGTAHQMGLKVVD